MPKHTRWIAALAGLAALALAAQEPPDDAAPARDSTLVEKTATRIVQLDVSLSGPEEQLADITAADFSVRIGTRMIDEFQVDKLCREAEPGQEITITTEAGVEQVIPAPTLPAATYMFYFDQRQLTMYGRQEGMETVRRLIPGLIKDGNRGMLLSNGKELATFAELTTDPQELLDGLARMENDADQWDPFATQEEQRLQEILSAMSDGGAGGSNYAEALSLARRYYREELWKAEQDLRRFQMALTRMAELEAPKAVIYLADTMRSNAGQHYLDMFGKLARTTIASEPDSTATLSDIDSGAEASFNQVIDEASAHGVRLYTVEAQGLTAPSSSDVPSTVRTQDAQGTLTGFAMETGGRAFLNGVKPAKIVEKIVADFSCLYLVSFLPEGLPTDTPLKVDVKVDRKKVRSQVRGRLVVQSDSAALTSRLLAAYTAPDSARGLIAVRASLVPMGFKDGKFSALVQVAVPGTRMPASTWDLGASVVSRGQVRQASQRMTVATSGAAVVLQQPMSFAPGPYELIAVAHNLDTDEVASEQLDGAWPRPNENEAEIGPIAVLQPVNAAISKDSVIQSSGAVAFAEQEPVWVDRPTAIVALVCKARDVKGDLHVERKLIGAGEVDFPITVMDLGKESCGIIQDLIPANTMTPGTFRYRLRVMDRSQEELAAQQHKFHAWSGDEADQAANAEITPVGGS